METLVNCPMTRKEFLTLPMDLRRKILSRQVDKLSCEQGIDGMHSNIFCKNKEDVRKEEG